MGYPGKGKNDYLALGDWNAACAECARKFKASEMIQLPPGVPGGGMYVCRQHWNMRQPQDYVRGIPDKMAAPWQQPIIETDFSNVCQTTTAIAGYAEAGCAVAGNSTPPYYLEGAV